MTARAWVIWAVTVTALSLTVTNPFYLGLMVVAVGAVAATAPAAPGTDGLRPLLAGGLVLVILAGLITALNGTAGTDVLFTVPGPTAPSWLGGLRLGGPVTREGLLAALSRALSLTAIFGAFATLTTTVSPSRLMRATPAALLQAGLVLTIGLAILPSALRDARRLREAELLRGRNLHWWNLPGLVPMIVLDGLERSIRLAEALETRGFGAGRVTRPAFLAGAAAPPLLLLASYLWLSGGRAALFALPPGALGLAALAWWLLAARAANHTTRLKRDGSPSTEAGGLVVALVLVGVSISSASARTAALRYDPFLDPAIPQLSIVGTVMIAALLWPTLAMAAAREHPERLPSGGN